jgi:hypothetical protein
MTAKKGAILAVNLMSHYQELSLHLRACQHCDDGFRFSYEQRAGKMPRSVI